MDAALQHWLPLILLLLAGCVTQQEQPAPMAPTEVAAAGTPDLVETQTVDTTVVCRTVARTGTHMHERRCYTKAELAEMSKQSREFIRSRGRKGAVYTPGDQADPRHKSAK